MNEDINLYLFLVFGQYFKLYTYCIIYILHLSYMWNKNIRRVAIISF